MPPTQTSRSPLAPLALIAVIVALVGLAFAWVGGWLTPGRIRGATLANSLEYNAGRHPGWRRAHAKGLCVSGHFDANGQGVTLSRASVFRTGSYPVVGRFSTGGSDPFATDGRNVFHAMALLFALPGGEQWRMALDHTPIFPVANAPDFVALQIASRPDPTTHKPDPAKMKAYLGQHPETKAFLDYLANAPLPSSFANGTYYSINAFRFIDAAGARHAVRWQMEPETPFAALDKATLDQQPVDFLFDDAVARLKQGPLRWHLVVVLANPGDRTDNATVTWPADRRRIDVGTLVLDRAATEADGGCRDYQLRSADPARGCRRVRRSAAAGALCHLFGLVPPPRGRGAAPRCTHARRQGRPGMTARFAPFARLLHWMMAVLILAMLFIGAGMLSTASARYPVLLAWHRPIGITILVLALIRLGFRSHASPARAARHSAGLAEGCGPRLALAALCADDRDAVDRLGDAVGWRLSGAPDQGGGAPADPAARHPSLRAAADGAWPAGLCLLSADPRPSRRGAVARADPAGRRVPEHGVIGRRAVVPPCAPVSVRGGADTGGESEA